ncbi:MAG: enoyl-CoA hydratase/isomerase family protein [Bacillota bacterium]
MDYLRYKTIVVQRNGGILTLTLNRPEKQNAVNVQLHNELSQIFHDVKEDKEAKVLVITGSGKAFCAGGDLDWIKELALNPQAAIENLTEAKKIITDLIDLEIPVIARVNGAAVGLGATLALFTDIIIASQDAVFADPHVKVGLVAGDGGAVIWPLLIGICKAKEFLITGDSISATEAERIGLINRVVPAESLDKTVYDLAQRLAEGPSRAINLTKVAINKNLKFFTNLILDDSLAFEGETFKTQDLLEGVNAIKERRKPSYKGI